MASALELFTRRLRLPARGTIALPALTGCADAFLALALTQPDTANATTVLAITPGIPDAETIIADLERIAGDPALAGAARTIRILEFPPAESSLKSALALRLKVLAALREPDASRPMVIVAAFPALLGKVPIGEIRLLTLRASDHRPLTALAGELAKLGYRRVPGVEREGDFAVRGGILDVWPPGDELPVRAEFFGDELENLRRFNPSTQLSIERIPAAELPPIEETAESGRHCTLFELLGPDAAVLAFAHNLYNLDSILPAGSLTMPVVYTGDPAPRGVPTAALAVAPLPGFADLGAEDAHHPELFEAARARLERHLTAAAERGEAIFRADELSGGFELADTFAVVTKADRVFARRRAPVRRQLGGARLNDFEELEPGEYVVHLDYGVGRYLGSSVITVDGHRSEVFTIEYADGGKLHVPAAHAHLLSRYVGVRGETVPVHRLDGKRWAKDRREAMCAVADLAAALLETQARRETIPGHAYDIECEGLAAFEAAFPYEETPDQAAAIAAVKQDLAATRPMDRLICGDAGYGKTEVAMRAAFIAAMNGKQTAMLAPTTVLAEQHFETFTTRFDGTPVRIEALSRFQSGDSHSGTFKRLLSGACDIVIGTHALLSAKTSFHDLGLIIIDEEQRFGVRHKEFLKRLRATADVLTLSATPIPRTLYLSMTGARDLSLLRTPPRERVAVETHIVRDCEETVRRAIAEELGRGGQVYFLHNRVATLGAAERRLCAIAPQARIVVAHGRLDARELAARMREFERGNYDILLSTTIVESGLDIPRANTILIDRADCFGLAELYQLRGRVGRSSRTGHAWFLLPSSGTIDSEARDRLDALQRHGGLGGGFNLAVRDLELRGAGNLLGSKQSGHIAAVGFNLYCQLLQRTIQRLKGEKVCEVVDVKLNLELDEAGLSYEYIEEDSDRLDLMKRFAEAPDVARVRALAAELRDRFGPLPPAARRFVRLAHLRTACAAAGIGRIDVKDRRAVLYRGKDDSIAQVAMLKATTQDGRLSELLRTVRGL